VKYLYKVYDLEGNLMLVADNVPLICICLGVSHFTVEKRIKKKVTKFDAFNNEKCKFNVTRRLRNGNN